MMKRLSIFLLSLGVLGLWSFPGLWYNRTEPTQPRCWLVERSRIKGWRYHPIPVSQNAERVLVADTLTSGEFTNAVGGRIRVFSAKRFREKENEIGLFVHTPDRCWTEAGWRLEPAPLDHLELFVGRVQLRLERRIFESSERRELVYFGGLVGGQPLPYRLDHNLSVGMRFRLLSGEHGDETALRARDLLLWNRVWQAFLSRRPLLGPKQFIRISTPIDEDQVAAADRRLRAFLPLWLKPTTFVGHEL